jgi:hypothetical protein
MLTFVISDIILGRLGLGACNGLRISLPLERSTVVTGALAVHGLLQRIAYKSVIISYKYCLMGESE